MEKQEQTIEEIFQEIDKIIENLEQQDVSLEHSFSLYAAGVKRLKECNDKIDAVEKKILVMNEQGDLEPFE